MENDLESIASRFVSLSLVADSFGDYTPEVLARCFPDRCIPFKSHFVVDCRKPLFDGVTKHHRYYARRALRDLAIERIERPGEFLDDWVSLYANLIRRHEISGIKAFSREAFRLQLAIPGMVAFRALAGGVTVGAHLWYQQGGVVHSHLAAFHEEGYRLMAAYALYQAAIEYFHPRADWLNFGAGAGVAENSEDGLTQFKRGWSNDRRQAWFCGRIFNRSAYDALCKTLATGADPGGFFPAYRSGV